MKVSRRKRRELLTWLVFIAFGAIAGHLYTLAIFPVGEPDYARWFPGARVGAMIAGATGALELFFVQGTRGARFRRLPFLQFLGLRLAAHTVIVTSLLAVNSFLARLLGETFADRSFEPGQMLRNTVFSLVVLAVCLFVAQARSLVGGRALANVVLGRYYRPRHEDRLFLLLDLKGSTPLSVRLGPEQFHELLAAAFFDVDAAITERGGEVYEYVGDAVIASWDLGAGDRSQRAVEAIFAAQDALLRRAPWYQQRFDAVPRFRAVLHRGSVVVGECGDSKRQIVFRGETLNTVARLEALAKVLEQDVVASNPGRGLTLPPGIRSHDLGSHDLKGLSAPVHVVALSAAA
jgi:class 3 adenylate cyclase